ncbi:hypothetical protein CF327_g4813 [Tilletia walkeri]|uniref:Phosphoribosyltransferase domain-containing protein n=1 Tax=Tilletia walkeri TaxID=117179 RepID=A0A8X7T2X9_9BASI|nr:hypothetical protein CF327_g4813 [Tilletia walkeri]KAE8234493.1 hypothetical protein CF326_g454 [Tilletia indica]KAE8266756.1 hypothetical protein A4X09_0g5591 [Tilletia walkeri]
MSSTETLPDDHLRITYNEVHLLLRDVAQRVKQHCPPDIIVAIGGGGFFPARVLRTFLKVPSKVDPSRKRSLPIQAIGLSLYEEVAGTSAEQIGTEVVRTQWLDNRQIAGEQSANKPKLEEGKDAGGLLGKNILIVDEVDDSRTTLQYAYGELLKDVRQARAALPESVQKQLPPTRFAIAVVHNKKKAKKGSLPIIEPEEFAASGQTEEFVDGVSTGVWYFAGETIEDDWMEYPWEQEDIIEHERLAALAKRLNAKAS